MTASGSREGDPLDDIVRIIHEGREERDANLDRVLAEARARVVPPLPRKRVTAGALIRDEAGRVLLVQSIQKRTWLTPGGAVEAHESPARGAAREVREELGVRLPIGRALVMQWERVEGDQDGVLHFAYDGGVVKAATVAMFRLPPDELVSYRFADPAEVSAFAASETAVRVAAAIEALADGTFIEVDH